MVSIPEYRNEIRGPINILLQLLLLQKYWL